MFGEIDEVAGQSSRFDGRFYNDIATAGERYDAAVVIRIAGAVKNQCATDTRDSLFKRTDNVRIAAF